MNTQDIVQKLWNLCHVLRDDGITYHEYVALSAVEPVGMVGQCFNLHCASCGSEGTGGCDKCFVEHCQATYDRVCRGH